MGYERKPGARLLFLHNRVCQSSTASQPPVGRGLFEGFRASRGRAGPGAWNGGLEPRSGLRIRRCPPDRDEIDGPSRRAFVEDADGQPPGPPRERIEVAAALIEQRTGGTIVMAVNDVKFSEASGKSFR